MGFTISGARNKMQELLAERDKKRNGEVMLEGVEVPEVDEADMDEFGGYCPIRSGDDVLQLAQFRRS